MEITQFHRISSEKEQGMFATKRDENDLNCYTQQKME